MNPDSVTDLTSEVLRFSEERNWRQFHNPKDMALSLCLEVAELLELMQWRNGEDLQFHLAERQRDVGEELSDILYWTLLIAHDLRINLPAAFMDKLSHNAMKYPVEKATGSSVKYTQLNNG